MATVSERSREILEKLRDVFKDDPTLAADMTLESATAYCDEKYSALIEQALLAERRLVWESAIQKVRDHKWVAMELTPTMKAYSEAVADIAEALRAAAEKEVSK